jgi:hypothetical protein
MGSLYMDHAPKTAGQAWIAPGEPIIPLREVTKSFGSLMVLEDILGLLRPERGAIWVDG